MKNILKIRMLAVATVALLVSAPASAVDTGNVNSDISFSSIERNASLTAINGELATMNAQLRSTDTYLQGGYNAGNGLLPLLSSINEKLGKSNSADGEQGSIDDTAARSRIYEQKMIDLKAAATPTQAEFKSACVAISSRMTSAQGHGAARGSADAFRAAREEALDREDRLKSQATPTQKLADVARDRNDNGFCDKADMVNGFPGCRGEGDLPNADIRSSSLTVGASASPSDPSNGSLNAKQVAAARAYIVNTSAMPPNIPDPAVLEKGGGKIYLASLNRFAARQAASGDAQSNILASHKSMPFTVNGQAEKGGIAQDWAQRKGDWQNIFANKLAFPTDPSERDMLRYEVYRYYTSADYQVFLQKTADDRGLSGLAREQLTQTALTNRLLFQLLQRQEDANVLLSQLLNQDMEPLTTQGLNTAASQAGR